MQASSKTDWERVTREAAADAPIAREPGGLYDPNDPADVDAFLNRQRCAAAASAVRKKRRSRSG